MLPEYFFDPEFIRGCETDLMTMDSEIKEFINLYIEAINHGWYHVKRNKSNTYDIVAPDHYACCSWKHETYFISLNGLTLYFPDYFYLINVIQCGELDYPMTDIN
jgi:hypothetical protein